MLILTTKYDIGTVADIVCGFSRQKIVLTNLDGRKNSRRSFVDLMFESVDIVVVRFKYCISIKLTAVLYRQIAVLNGHLTVLNG